MLVLKISNSEYAVITATQDVIVIIYCCVIMEANKENVPEKIATRIPLPLHPLPPLPTKLLKQKGKNIEKRQPLQTLAQENVIPSTSNAMKDTQENSITKTLKNLDTRFVTMRQKNEQLDTNHDILKDHDGNTIVISDDDEATDGGNIKDGTIFDGTTVRLALTPSEKQVENLQVRNIKRSLKRPSSRELQGLSPPDTREKRHLLPAKRRLRFPETPDSFQSPDSWIQSHMRCLDTEYTEDLINHLLATEQPPAAVIIPRLTRACLINWLVKMNGLVGNPGIVQTACWYFDSILCTETVPLDKIQLVIMACFWIAQKLHGPVMYSSSLIKMSANAFTQEMLMDAEKLIMVKLGFPPQPVIPQDFIAYLAWWCDADRPGEIELAANFLCMTGLMVVKELGAMHPSMVACAAIGTALIILRGKAAMKRIQDCPVYKTAETRAGSLLHTCAVLKKAVCIIADPLYAYKAPIEHFTRPPHFIVQHIIKHVQQRARPGLDP